MTARDTIPAPCEPMPDGWEIKASAGGLAVEADGVTIAKVTLADEPLVTLRLVALWPSELRALSRIVDDYALTATRRAS